MDRNDLNTGRFYFADFPKAVVANVQTQDSASVTLSRALPFLKLQSSIRDEHGRNAKLQDVNVLFDGDTPRLVLKYNYQAELPKTSPKGLRAQRRNPTVPYAFDSQPPALPPSSQREPSNHHLRESTIQFGVQTSTKVVETSASAPAMIPYAPKGLRQWVRHFWLLLTPQKRSTRKL